MADHDSNHLRRILTEFVSRKDLTINGWAKLAGIPESTIRNFLARRSSTLTHATLVALARAAGTTIVDLLGTRTIPAEEVRVLYEIKADYWVKHYFADHEARFWIQLPEDPRYPGLERIGALVSDDSCDLLFQSGTILICARYADLKETPQSGDKVLCVETKRDPNDDPDDPPSFERTTLREYVLDETDVPWLTLRSRSPRWQGSLLADDFLFPPIGERHIASHAAIPHSWTEVEGKVIASYRLE